MHLLPKKSPILTYYLLILHNYLAKLTFMAVRGLLYLSKVAIMRKAIGIIRLMPDTTSGSKSFSNTATERPAANKMRYADPPIKARTRKFVKTRNQNSSHFSFKVR
ncbi:hypothetical protein pdam_00004261, partial [Pocillopora damicornis]